MIPSDWESSLLVHILVPSGMHSFISKVIRLSLLVLGLLCMLHLGLRLQEFRTQALPPSQEVNRFCTLDIKGKINAWKSLANDDIDSKRNGQAYLQPWFDEICGLQNGTNALPLGTKFVWFITDGLSLRLMRHLWLNETRWGSHGSVLAHRIRYARWSHAVYTSIWTGLSETNFMAVPAVGDNLLAALSRSGQRIRYHGPEWSLLQVIGGAKHLMSTGALASVKLESEELYLKSQVYGFLGESRPSPGQPAWSVLENELSEASRAGESLLFHSGTLDKRFHFAQEATEADIARLEPLHDFMWQWVQQHPDYAVISSSDHGANMIQRLGRNYAHWHGESSRVKDHDNVGFMKVYHHTLPKGGVVDIDVFDVCSSVAALFPGADIPFYSSGKAHPWRLQQEPGMTARNLLQMVQHAQVRGLGQESSVGAAQTLLRQLQQSSAKQSLVVLNAQEAVQNLSHLLASESVTGSATAIVVLLGLAVLVAVALDEVVGEAVQEWRFHRGVIGRPLLLVALLWILCHADLFSIAASLSWLFKEHYLFPGYFAAFPSILLALVLFGWQLQCPRPVMFLQSLLYILLAFAIFFAVDTSNVQFKLPLGLPMSVLEVTAYVFMSRHLNFAGYHANAAIIVAWLAILFYGTHAWDLTCWWGLTLSGVLAYQALPLLAILRCTVLRGPRDRSPGQILPPVWFYYMLLLWVLLSPGFLQYRFTAAVLLVLLVSRLMRAFEWTLKQGQYQRSLLGPLDPEVGRLCLAAFVDCLCGTFIHCFVLGKPLDVHFNVDGGAVGITNWNMAPTLSGILIMLSQLGWWFFWPLILFCTDASTSVGSPVHYGPMLAQLSRRSVLRLLLHAAAFEGILFVWTSYHALLETFILAVFAFAELMVLLTMPGIRAWTLEAARKRDSLLT